MDIWENYQWYKSTKPCKYCNQTKKVYVKNWVDKIDGTQKLKTKCVNCKKEYFIVTNVCS